MQTTFLTEDQIWGGSALDVIKKYGTQTALTDLANIPKIPFPEKFTTN